MAYGDSLNEADFLAIGTDTFLGLLAFFIQNFSAIAIFLVIALFVIFLVKKFSNG